ncbi:MAG: hypothetical protein OXG83_02600 [Acidobacteria bacterium]|nr:hypothetical protein [Acidobacteriota bacterium]
MLLVALLVAVLVLGVIYDISLGACLLLKMFSKAPDGPESPRYRGR